MEGATHFIEQYRSKLHSEVNVSTPTFPIRFLTFSLSATIEAGMITIAIFKIKLKDVRTTTKGND